jgi:hypothetical protein
MAKLRVDDFNRITVTKSQLDAAEQEVAKILEIGRKGTDADYTALGGLYYIIQALDIRVRVEEPCNHKCDPDKEYDPNSSHFLDCPVWPHVSKFGG